MCAYDREDLLGGVLLLSLWVLADLTHVLVMRRRDERLLGHDNGGGEGVMGVRVLDAPGSET